MNKILRPIKLLAKHIVFNISLFFCALYIRMFKIKHLLFMAPYHGNLGDHAIVLAEEQILSENGVKAFEVNTKAFDCCGRWFTRMIPSDAVIYLTGGGFMGSLWRHEEERVRKVFTFFANNKIVVFPQTITFEEETSDDKAFFEDSKKIYSGTQNMILFVRDKNSFDFVKKEMPQLNVKLVPDIVTRLKIENNKQVKRCGIVYCLRKDHEKNLTDDMSAAVFDFVKEKYSNESVSYTDTVESHNISRYNRKQEVADKLLQFAGSKLVITDRLHGMIMAAITNTPCIAFGNSNGKVKGVYSWIKNNEFIKYVDNLDQFKDALNNLNLDKRYEYYIDETLFTELSNAITK